MLAAVFLILIPVVCRDFSLWPCRHRQVATRIQPKVKLSNNIEV
jgi:hypothetical protein